MSLSSIYKSVFSSVSSFSKSTFGNLKSLLRLAVVKTVGLVLAVVFLFLGGLFLGYSAVSIVATLRGHDAKIDTFSGQMGKRCTAFRLGGLFQVTAEMDKKKYGKIYCLYPAWPDTLNPSKGDIIRVWPAKQPLAGAPAVDGWGWFIVGTFLIVGLVMLEFAFLALTIQ